LPVIESGNRLHATTGHRQTTSNPEIAKVCAKESATPLPHDFALLALPRAVRVSRGPG